MPEIVDLAAEDEAAWRRLWAGYLDFYAADVPAAATEACFANLLDPASPLVGRVARVDGIAVGFSHTVLHLGTWTTRPVAYLEDLFVAPNARGHGVGRALLDDLVTRAAQDGWGRLYWMTRADNAAARRLYDRFVAADDFVRYRMIFD